MAYWLADAGIPTPVSGNAVFRPKPALARNSIDQTGRFRFRQRRFRDGEPRAALRVTNL